MKKVIVIVGPTASGKTALGIEVAKKINGAVISADSRQVFAGMNIGTAKPKEAWQAGTHDALTPDNVSDIPHYLLNIKKPTESYSLAEWQQDAFTVADHLVESGKVPIVVGGTMLYVDSFVYNYQLPNVPPNPELRQELEALSVEELFRLLVKEDPAIKEFIEPNNKRRIIRALEVIKATGQPFSVQRQRQEPRYDSTFLGLFPGWEKLKENIAQRAEAMMNSELIAEAEALAEKYGIDLPLLQTLNYRQALAVTQGKITESEALTSMIQDTNRYAHRQMSWWNRAQNIQWFTTSKPSAAALTQFLLQ